MNLKIKSKKFSISLKIFLLLTFLTYLSIGLSLGANFFYLEKYQISQRKQILLRFAKKYKDVPKDEFIRFLDEEGIFFKEDSVESLKSLAELNPNITTASISKNRFIGIVKGRDKVNRIILIEKTGDNKVIMLSSPVASITSIIDVSFKFYIILLLGSIPLNLILAYILSRKMGKPIEDELLQLNEKLRKELEKEKQLEEFRKKFISNISHELKTPISIISGYSDAIVDGIIEEKDVVDICKNINSEASNMDKLIKALLFYTKLESKYVSSSVEEIDLKKLIEDVVSRYSLDFQMNDLNLNLDLKKVSIETDRNLFEIVINNLITNAISYVDNRKKIEIILDEKCLVIKNSFGNPENIDLKEYFKPFSRKKVNKNQKYGGTGLGLSIVSKILTFLDFKYDFKYDDSDKHAVFKIDFYNKNSRGVYNIGN